MAFNTQFGPQLASLLEQERRGMSKQQKQQNKRLPGLLGKAEDQIVAEQDAAARPIGKGRATNIMLGGTDEILQNIAAGQNQTSRSLDEADRYYDQLLAEVKQADWVPDISKIPGRRGWRIRAYAARNPYAMNKIKRKALTFEINAVSNILGHKLQIAQERRLSNKNPVADAALDALGKETARKISLSILAQEVATAVDKGEMPPEIADKIMQNARLGMDVDSVGDASRQRKDNVRRFGESTPSMPTAQAVEQWDLTEGETLIYEEGKANKLREIKRQEEADKRAEDALNDAKTRLELAKKSDVRATAAEDRAVKSAEAVVEARAAANHRAIRDDFRMQHNSFMNTRKSLASGKVSPEDVYETGILAAESMKAGRPGDEAVQEMMDNLINFYKYLLDAETSDDRTSGSLDIIGAAEKSAAEKMALDKLSNR